MKEKYTIEIGEVCPTDATLVLSGPEGSKEYAIEGAGWWILEKLMYDDEKKPTLPKIVSSDRHDVCKFLLTSDNEWDGVRTHIS